ncbi:hypothetical protein [uncultured Maribacter sp.]|uniref:hypothetical protein n=1 Tax=uncultured Maribacter sp. TaxID=431308 RepID=UPI0030EB7E35|tara:strand:- start:60936 stop:61127 length:192 start_codon:yes stop_codon:yes gene_type:complete
MAKVQKHNSYNQATIEAQHVFSENNQVFVRNNTFKNCKVDEEWSPIPFEWTKVVKLQDSLVLG